MVGFEGAVVDGDAEVFGGELGGGFGDFDAFGVDAVVAGGFDEVAAGGAGFEEGGDVGGGVAEEPAQAAAGFEAAGAGLVVVLVAVAGEVVGVVELFGWGDGVDGPGEGAALALVQETVELGLVASGRAAS